MTDFRAIDDKSLTDVACSNEEVRFVENEHNITGHNKIGGHIPDNRGDDTSMDLMKMTTVTPIKQQSQSWCGNIPSTIGSATKQWTRYDSLRSVTECESSFKRRTSLFSNIIQSNKTLFTTTCNYRRNKTSNHTDNKIIFYVNSPRESYSSIDTTARYDGLRQMLRRVLPYRSAIIDLFFTKVLWKIRGFSWEWTA